MKDSKSNANAEADYENTPNPMMIEPKCDTTIQITFCGSPVQQRINPIGTHRNLFSTFLEDDPNFELVCSSNSSKTVSEVEDFPKYKKELRELVEDIAINYVKNNVVTVQTIRTSRKLSYRFWIS